MRIRFDLEADGLLPTLTRIWVMSVRWGDDPNRYRYVGHDKIKEALAKVGKEDVLVAHNGIAFDLMALYKVFKWKPPCKVEDTFVFAQLVDPDNDGFNSLEWWGHKLGQPKMDYLTAYIEYKTKLNPEYKYQRGDEWSEYTPVMAEYCDRDVDALVAIDEHFLKVRAEYNWEPSYRMELRFAMDFAVQGMRGVKVDVPLAMSLVERMDAELGELAAEVEPQLPEKPGTQAQLREYTPPKNQFLKNGQPSANTERWFDQLYHVGDDDVRRLGVFSEPAEVGWYGQKGGKWHHLPTPMLEDGSARAPLRTTFPMQMSDGVHIKTWLMQQGWQPTMWSYKKAPDAKGKLRFVRSDSGELIPTQPKLHDKGELCKNLEEMIEAGDVPPIAKQVVRWMVVRHRRGFVNSILENVRADGRVAAEGLALGTPTSRVKHKVVANAPKAEEGVVYGKECRSIFIESRGALVGVDASGLELRCLAHYAKSPMLTDVILKGKKPDEEGYCGIDEIHMLLWKACNPLVPSRSIQKNVTF